MRRRAIALLVLVAAAAGAAPASASVPTTPIRHIVVLMQENHSFDNYFGTYPGVDGLPARTCLPKSFVNAKLGCFRPSHVGGRAVQGLGSDVTLFARQLHGGRMDGFVAAYRVGRGLGGLPNPMGYYDNRDLPYAWNLAARYVLFDRFFSSARGGSVWNHLFAISATPGNRSADERPAGGYPDTTTIFDRLEQAGIPWRYYVKDYDSTNTIDNPVVGDRAVQQLLQVPLLAMPRFVRSHELKSHIVDMQKFYRDAQRGRLPAVSYIAPGGLSEHPPGKLIAGQTFVRSILTELMRSPEWSSTAFVLTYDSWGGWYDHVRPPKVDRYGYGFRVPALLVSPYAKRGAIDHTTLDFTSILRFIEDNWGLAPLAQRDASAQSIATAFDFSAPPRLPELVPTSSSAPRVATAHTRVVFWAYGGAGLLALAFVAAAFASSRRRGGSVVIAPPARGPRAPARGYREAPEGVWERWRDEPEEAWRAFVAYREMGRGRRSQRAVSSGLRHEALSAAQAAANVREWSVRWHWIERCRAYDRQPKLEVSR
ncbi:MAG: alkaline phosphatase family protein [Actinomycetota bacterium]|nr:alkaline phosphatase family protein [Actinomycetota bacterium]